MSWVRDRRDLWHRVGPTRDVTVCGREVGPDTTRVDIPGAVRCRPCEGTATARAAARDHIAEAREALAAAASRRAHAEG